jgi:hypothetical protein
MKVSEWQVAMAAIKGDSTGRSDGSCNGLADSVQSEMAAQPTDGSTTHRCSLSSVKVPVCRNNHLYVYRVLLNMQNK